MLEGKDLLTLLREEESSLKRKGLMDKLVKIVDYLWETKSVYKELTPERELQEVKKALLNSTFQFSSTLMDSQTKQTWEAASHYPAQQGWYHRDGCAFSFMEYCLWRDFCASISRERSRSYYFLSWSPELGPFISRAIDLLSQML